MSVGAINPGGAVPPTSNTVAGGSTGATQAPKACDHADGAGKGAPVQDAVAGAAGGGDTGAVQGAANIPGLEGILEALKELIAKLAELIENLVGGATGGGGTEQVPTQTPTQNDVPTDKTPVQDDDDVAGDSGPGQDPLPKGKTDVAGEDGGPAPKGKDDTDVAGDSGPGQDPLPKGKTDVAGESGPGQVDQTDVGGAAGPGQTDQTGVGGASGHVPKYGEINPITKAPYVYKEGYYQNGKGWVHRRYNGAESAISASDLPANYKRNIVPADKDNPSALW